MATRRATALEWARLALQLWELGGRTLDWLPDAARALFARAVGEGWDATRGGLYYTLEWSGAPRVRDRLWWPCCEGIGAATFLGALDGDAFYEDWYRRSVGLRRAPFHRSPPRRLALRSSTTRSTPSPAISSASPTSTTPLQACLIPLYPTDGSLTRGILGETRGG